MAVLEVTGEEAQLLESALHAYHDTLLLEIAHADTRAFRDALRRREAVAHGLLQRLRTEVPEAVSAD